MHKLCDKKHIKNGLISLISAFSVSFTVISVSALINGDLNSDNKIDLLDYIYEKNIISDNQFSDLADIDGNNSVNINDLEILSTYFLGKSDYLPQKDKHNTDKLPVRTQVTSCDDICIRADGNKDEDNILNVAGYNAAIRRNVFLKFKTSDLDLTNVSDAQISMKLARTANGNCEIKVYAYNSQWSEADPPPFEESSDYYGLCDIEITKHPDDAGSIISFDVTDVVRENPQASEFNFVMVCDHPNNSDALSNLALFYSKDSQDPQAQSPSLIVRCNEDSQPESEPILADNEKIRFELPDNSGKFIRISESKISVERNVSPFTDAEFIEKDGLYGDKTVSFESVSEPGWYLVRKEGTSEIILSRYEDAESFRKNATFVKYNGLSKGTSYQAYGLPGRWLSCTGSQLFISSSRSNEKKNAVSFLVRSKKNAVMKDEFNGNSLDTNIWKYSYPWSDHHNYSAVFRQSQVAVRDGKLILTATRVADDNWIKDDKGETGYTDNIGEKKWRKYSHLTGVVHLPFSKYPLNGNVYIEGKFKMPDKSGFWPAFWLNGNNSWPPEIDIFEYLSNTPEKIYVGIHRQDSSKSNGDGGAGWWINRNSSFFQQEFHTYALDWGKTYINYYIDDILVKSIEDKAYIENQKNMYMIINLGVGGWAEEPVDSVGDNTTYECDYVRIFGY